RECGLRQMLKQFSDARRADLFDSAAVNNSRLKSRDERRQTTRSNEHSARGGRDGNAAEPPESRLQQKIVLGRYAGARFHGYRIFIDPSVGVARRVRQYCSKGIVQGHVADDWSDHHLIILLVIAEE